MKRYDLDLVGRTVGVSGAAGFLGRAIVQGVLTQGGDICMFDLDEKRLHDFKNDLVLSGFSSDRISFYTIDLSSLKVGDCFDMFAESRCNCLVNNAAFVGTSELEGWCVPFEGQCLDTWRKALEVNLTSNFTLSKDFVSSLSGAKGAIVNIDSIYAHLGPDWNLYEGTEMGNPAAYGVSKAGLVQLTRYLASTLGPTIRVNTVAPGGIERGQDLKFQQRYRQKTPLRRMATEEDVVGTVLFLLSSLADYITGQSIKVDGGYIIT